MKKVMTILQLIIGVVVILFALVLMWQALVALIPGLKSILSAAQLPFTLKGMSAWLELILAVFIMQVVAVYTKKLFDTLSVS
jgi:hypothetical protein